MGKRILALTLAFVMLLAMVPAAGAETTVQEIPATGLRIRISRLFDSFAGGIASSTPSATYRAGEGSAEWNNTTKTLTLTNATIPAATTADFSGISSGGRAVADDSWSTGRCRNNRFKWK